uniref:Uncharacterized protein n=1 Tax=Utricularia reniformis TaxID=192314 RepID=A0A1Y0AZ04_9LAMI|nr:hypothetical protein AEK19_MT1444 [Utricularia reniformis]ART30381.1 hypothetical protein AEK19_MT1444 [Utricularia reniformis]
MKRVKKLHSIFYCSASQRKVNSASEGPFMSTYRGYLHYMDHYGTHRSM